MQARGSQMVNRRCRHPVEDLQEKFRLQELHRVLKFPRKLKARLRPRWAAR